MVDQGRQRVQVDKEGDGLDVATGFYLQFHDTFIVRDYLEFDKLGRAYIKFLYHSTRLSLQKRAANKICITIRLKHQRTSKDDASATRAINEIATKTGLV